MTTTDEIRAELYTALESLGAESDLLSIVGSWGDTLEDEEVLAMLKDWNAGRADARRRERVDQIIKTNRAEMQQAVRDYLAAVRARTAPLGGVDITSGVWEGE